MINNQPIKSLYGFLVLLILVLGGCNAAGSAVEDANNMTDGEEEETGHVSELEIVKPAATQAEESMQMPTKNVLVELRVPRELTADEVLAFIAGELAAAGFDLDEAYQPVPITPGADMAAEVVVANEEIVLVRGTIGEGDEENLKQNPRVTAVWTDAAIAPFEE